MRNINKLAYLFDKTGNYNLADKLDRIAQVQNNDVLETNDPNTFVTSLFNFARNRNINNLSQAYNVYSQSGAKYQGSPISSNKDTVRLYKYVVQNPRMLYPQQLVGVLQGNTSSANIFQNNREDLETRANSDNLNDEAVPTDYSYYYNYLKDRGINRIAPIGVNNDNQRREPGVSSIFEQNKLYQEYITNIEQGQDINAAIDEIKSDANLTVPTRQKLLSELGYK